MAFDAFFSANIGQRIRLAVQFIALFLRCKIDLSSHLLINSLFDCRMEAKCTLPHDLAERRWEKEQRVEDNRKNWSLW